jgi:S-disulfanyl-L-cysteine oxidoreductase SoxD
MALFNWLIISTLTQTLFGGLCVKVLSVIILLLAVLVLAGCQTAVSDQSTIFQQFPSITATPPIPPPPELDTEEIAVGKTIYEQYCAACHGFALEGQPDWKTQNEDGTFKAPPHNADGHTWHHADSQLIKAIELGGARFDGVNVGGISPMPAYANILSNEEMTAILTYIKSTWPDKLRQAQWEVTIMSSQQ